MTVLGQLIRQMLDLLFELPQTGVQLQQDRDHCLFSGTIDGDSFFPGQRLPHFAVLFCFRFVRRRVSRLRVSIVHSTISPF